MSVCLCVCVCVRACVRVRVCVAGNSNSLFSIDRQTGLVTRGLRALDRETSSSHMLEVEAYNSDEGSMRSSVRVRKRRIAGENGEEAGTCASFIPVLHNKCVVFSIVEVIAPIYYKRMKI